MKTTFTLSNGLEVTNWKDEKTDIYQGYKGVIEKDTVTFMWWKRIQL